MEKNLGEIIGRGGHGVVHLLLNDPELVVKISDKSGTDCRKWSDENSKLLKIKDSLPLKERGGLRMVDVLFPESYVEEKNGGTRCYMILPRIFPPDEGFGKLTVHPLFGEEDYKKLFPGRGLFIGLREIETILGPDDIKRVVIELGVMMGLLHFSARNDAFDIEIFIGRERSPNSPVKLYIADFDLTETIDRYDDDTIENRLYWSLEAVSYFPTGGYLYELFKAAYTEIAVREMGNEGGRIAERLFDLYN